MYRAAFVLTLLGAVLIVVAVVVPFVFPSIFEAKLTEKLIIRPQSDMLKSFQETPIPIYFQVWFFNVTNKNQVIEGEKPVLQQLGPYTYRQRNQRVDIRFDHVQGTVSYKSLKHYHFDPDRSSGTESDLITTINPVYNTLVSNPAVPEAVKTVFARPWFMRFGTQLFMTQPVGELLFKGYDEPILGELAKLTKDPAHALAKFGFFYPRNGSKGAETEVYTGELGIENYQNIFKWNNATKLSYWPRDRCNVFNGTDGGQFPRPVRRENPVRLFTADLCRSIYATYEKDVQVGPLTLYRFVLPPELLAAGAEGGCFCTSNFTCRDSMIDISPCRKGAPVVISTPHFYQGDEVDVNNVVGLRPLKEEHQTFLDLEPNTGVAMRVSKRIQVNMPLRRFPSFPLHGGVPELILPILWMNESAEVPIERIIKLHSTLTTPLIVVKYGSVAILVVGLILILVAGVLAYLTYKKANKLSKRRRQFSDKASDAKSKEPLNKLPNF